MSTGFTFIHQRRKHRRRLFILVLLLSAVPLAFLSVSFAAEARTTADDLMNDVRALSALADRSTGTSGNQAAAEYIRKRFAGLGFQEIGVHRFSLPVLQHGRSTLFLIDQNREVPISPILGNAISPGTIPPQGISGPLVYVGAGSLSEFNGKVLDGAIVLMELDSGKHWQNAANFGAKALIYIDRGPTAKTFFNEKIELSPVSFPRFWLPLAEAQALFGRFESTPGGRIAAAVRLRSDVVWQESVAENIYCLAPGRDAESQDNLLLVEAFYDSTALVAGRSPGADEAISVATLLDLARTLKENPPNRPVLLVATGGHAQTLAGMRELVWSIWERAKEIRDRRKYYGDMVKNTRKVIKGLNELSVEGAAAAGAADEASGGLIRDALIERIKTEVDAMSRTLMRLRMQTQDADKKQTIQSLALQRLVLRRLSWRTDFIDLDPPERTALKKIIPLAVKDQQAILADALKRQDELSSAGDFRSLAMTKEIDAMISLHLSSRGDGLGAFNNGWLYPLKPTINRIAAYSTLDTVLQESAQILEKSLDSPGFFHDTLRPSQRRSWQSYLPDSPPLGGEVSALAGHLGITLATVNDARPYWGTPYDQAESVDADFAAAQSFMVSGLVRAMAQAPALQSGSLPRNGFTTVNGRAKFLRHGELFADQPAPESAILAFQGPASYHALVDHMGQFELKGVADSKHVLDKVIIEGYRFEPETGDIIWAIDKVKTGLSAYRLKMQRRTMQTDLVMFACRQSTLFNLLEPRNFNYMTRIQLLDGSREAPPLRYWWSRIDTRTSTILSIFLESGTHYKMTLSDNLTQKKLILINADENHPQGIGYRIDDWPLLKLTEYRVARDMWTLLDPRISNLETHGIYNERIRSLQHEGAGALAEAEKALEEKRYDRFAELSSRSWALAARVYDDVEKTQKDVLFGVLFYIALFVPFAFCLERFLFCYTDIYKRIIAFVVILILLIAVIYKVHPAFQLAYSPMVVILAFFIMGLSLMVTLIIFLRFEDEMILLQRHARHIKAEEISRWKAFVASFFLGVSNLRRRRLRTLLTCITLIILTFTIMSFTSVKTLRHHTRLRLLEHAPYQGFLFKSVNWQSLPPEADDIFSNTFEKKGIVLPRIWMEALDRTQSTSIPVRFHDQLQEAQGLVGLSHQEPLLTAADGVLTGGRWFTENERQVILLPERMAAGLGIDPHRPEGSTVLLWGVPYGVVGTFSGSKLMDLGDLDGEPLTPVTFPSEAAAEMTEVEMDAAESGDDVRVFQSRYQHVSGDLTLIIPYRTLLAAGGRLKSLSIRPVGNMDMPAAAEALADRFGLILFSGEKDGAFLYNAGDAMSYSGVPNIAIPLIISIFIVLNTMIGSVYERKREIGIYTSVGLAPSHVSFLFIAEAMAFAVLSVVLGYLVAQTSAYLFAGTSLWAGITVNYSSLAGVAAMLLVILVVLVSVIYPSRVAAEIAIPDVHRSWKLPQAKNNTIELTLPFLMEYKEHKSIGGYIFDYFNSHQDVSHGGFSTDEIFFDFVCATGPTAVKAGTTCSEGACCRDACLQLHTNVWLAPFDFGIMQRIDIEFCPAEAEAGFLEIKIRLLRKSGEANAWRRINKAFLHALRKQLLIWRSLDEGSRDYFENMLMTAETAAELEKKSHT